MFFDTGRSWFKPKSVYDWVFKIESYVRFKILHHRRFLVGSWTIESIQELEIAHGLDIEQELVVVLTEEINKEKEHVAVNE